MEPLPTPTSLEEVQRLIQAFYSPTNTPDTIKAIQEVLQRLQKSDQGWQLAQSLISSPDNKIKFFAALTIIVKLNRESANLSEDDSRELLQKIVAWLLQSMTDGTANFVIQKLCSALVTHFIHFSQQWPKCLRQLIYCLDVSRSSPVEALDEALQTAAIVGHLDSRKMWIAVQFATALVEEVGKTDMNSGKYLQVHDRLVGNAPDVLALLERGLSQTPEGCGDISLKCYQAWILYAQRANTDLLNTPLRTLVEPAMKCFPNEELFHETAHLFTDVLQNYSSFLTEPHYDALFSLFDTPWAAQLYGQLREDTDNQEAMSFGLLLLAYGDAKLQDLMTSTHEASQRFLDRLVGLLGANGYLVAEDSIFVPALEFWSTFVENMIDHTYSNCTSPDEDESRFWRPYADQHLKNVVINCWRKIQWPSAEVFATWDSDDRAGFSDARIDVADMLNSIFTLNGVTLVTFFVDLFHQSLQAQSWAEVEASEYCLGALSDCVTEKPEYDGELSRVFSAPFFDLLGGEIPLRLRQTGLSLIERYCEYFERHSDYLPNALNLLFAAVGDSALGAPSAKSISTLCSSCRSILTGETEAFIRHYQIIRSGKVLDSLAEEKIVHAIAAIIQAIPDASTRLLMFEELYRFIKQDIERAAQLKAQPGILNLSDPNFSRGLESWNSPQPIPPPDEIALQIALRALRCLSNMAKGLQDTKDRVVELDGDGHPEPTDTRLVGIQSDIIALLAGAQQTFSGSGEVVETICNIFRAGFTETEPGPFVFPAEILDDFFTQQPYGTPRLGTLLSTACSFVGSLYRGPRMTVPNHLARLLPWVVGALQALPEPDSDTEVSQNGIVLVEKIMARYPEVLFQLQPPQLLEFFFMFTLKVLNGKEPLPKIAAADFWSGFISLKTDDTALQATVLNAMAHLGPLLTQTLVQNIGGNAARSELEKVSDPLKKLVTNQPRAQAWLEQALFDPSFPSTQVTREDKVMFLKKIIGLRGARQTNQVVREFWLSCRGSNFAYAS